MNWPRLAARLLRAVAAELDPPPPLERDDTPAHVFNADPPIWESTSRDDARLIPHQDDRPGFRGR